MKKISARLLDLLIREAKNHSNASTLNAVLAELTSRNCLPISPLQVKEMSVFELQKEVENRLVENGISIY